MENFKVNNIIIGKQFGDSENLRKFMQIVNERKIKVTTVEIGDKINIEKNVYFDILWPDSSNVINENTINNNALVCKLNYKNFSMLFTGDIEEEAENVLTNLCSKKDGAIYFQDTNGGNQNILKSTILKVGHHGSKTSSTEEFLKLVNPKIALIGVGKNNLYGHPSDEVISRFNELRNLYL